MPCILNYHILAIATMWTGLTILGLGAIIVADDCWGARLVCMGHIGVLRFKIQFGSLGGGNEMEKRSLTKYVVKWRPVFSPLLDFVLPTQACGEKIFNTKKNALEFIKKIRQATTKVGSHCGQEVFGHELEIHLSKLVSVSTKKQ